MFHLSHFKAFFAMGEGRASRWGIHSRLSAYAQMTDVARKYPWMALLIFKEDELMNGISLVFSKEMKGSVLSIARTVFLESLPIGIRVKEMRLVLTQAWMK